MTADPGRASSPPPGLHSLRILTSSVSEPGTWRSRFFGVGYVDDTEVARFDSDSAGQGLKLPLKIFDDPVSVNLTRKMEQHEQTSRANLYKLLARDDQSEDGAHTFQEMTGCVVGSDGRFLQGFSQFAYDGADYVYLNQDLHSWTPVQVKVAKVTRTRTSPSYTLPHLPAAEKRRITLEDTCVHWLRLLLEKGKETLLRADPPKTHVTRHPISDHEV
ncbi:patr class I histocompatibility antigen, A-2 alpha chain-like, partial [Sturnira hondurensis]|uniref:patr class I histocompatibility antigen, A-2 alpha chain-like n=1 Tax=Sturnira hondurensis TaxID=192404 RepID=UPI00187A3DE0